MSVTKTSNDVTALVASLDPKQLAERLRELDQEQAAIRVLLRAARARTREETPRKAKVAHATN